MIFRLILTFCFQLYLASENKAIKGIQVREKRQAQSPFFNFGIPQLPDNQLLFPNIPYPCNSFGYGSGSPWCSDSYASQPFFPQQFPMNSYLGAPFSTNYQVNPWPQWNPSQEIPMYQLPLPYNFDRANVPTIQPQIQIIQPQPTTIQPMNKSDTLQKSKIDERSLSDSNVQSNDTKPTNDSATFDNSHFQSVDSKNLQYNYKITKNSYSNSEPQIISIVRTFQNGNEVPQVKIEKSSNLTQLKMTDREKQLNENPSEEIGRVEDTNIGAATNKNKSKSEQKPNEDEDDDEYYYEYLH